MNDEQQIRDLVATWIAATKACDLDTVLDLMTEDVVFLTQGHPPMVGRDAFAQAARNSWARGQVRMEGESDIKEIEVTGDRAFLWQHLVINVTLPGAAPVRRSGHTLSVFRKDGGKWRLTRDANLLD